MARATLTRITVGVAGSALSMVAVDAAGAGDGDAFPNNGRTYIIIENGDGSDTLTATLVTAQTVSGYDVEDQTITVGAGETKIFGPFPTTLFNQESGSFAGHVLINYTGTANAIDNSTIGVFN